MHKILTIAIREYRAMIVTKGFLIGLAIVPIMFLGGAIIPQLIGKSLDLDDKKLAVIDRSGRLYPVLEQAALQYNTTVVFDSTTKKQIGPKIVLESIPIEGASDELKLDLSDRVRQRKLHAFADIAPAVFEMRLTEPPVTYHSENSAMSDTKRWLDSVINGEVRRARIAESGLDADLVNGVTSQVVVDGRGLLTRNSSGTGPVQPAAKSNAMETLFVPMGCMMLMFMLIFMALQPMLECVLEEKQQRVGEVLLGSVNSTQLMGGKLLGNVAGSLTVFVIYASAGFGIAWFNDVLDKVPWRVVPWFLLFHVCAVLMFSGITMAFASASNNLQEAQGYMMLVWMPLIVPMFVWLSIVQNPNGSFATWFSLIPPVTPLTMVLRIAASSAVPLWQILLGVALTIAFTVLCVVVAGRIFRIGMLSQGKAPKLVDLLKWAFVGV